MSAELIIAGIVSPENTEDTKADIVEEEENVTSKDDATIQADKCKDEDDVVRMGYNVNIYNAYILFKALNIKDSATLQDLRISTYIILAVQIAAMVILIRLVMLQSGVNVADDYKMEKWPIENSMMMFPFFIIGCLSLWKDYSATTTDGFLLMHDLRFEPFAESALIKFCEAVVTAYGSFGFLVVIALYAQHDWNGILNSVLNLLAYEFILQLDEGVASMVNARLSSVLQEEGRELKEVFTGKVMSETLRTKGKYFNFNFPASLTIILIFTYVLPLQAIYSRSWVLFCFFPLMFCLFFCLAFCLIKARVAAAVSDPDHDDVDHEEDEMTMP